MADTASSSSSSSSSSAAVGGAAGDPSSVPAASQLALPQAGAIAKKHTVKDVLEGLEKVPPRVPLEAVAHGLALGGCEVASAAGLKLGSIMVEHLIEELLLDAKRTQRGSKDADTVDAPDDAWARTLAGAGATSVPVRAEVLLEEPLPADE